MSNDRLKFRFWDNEYGMSGIFDIKELVYLAHDADPVCSPPMDIGDNIWMQSTGLRDKNGVLIFEHDILCTDFEFSELTVVRWEDSTERFFGYLDGTPELDMEEMVHGEIVGNIYENPELLEKNE